MHGDLVDYNTNETIRPATREERMESLDAGHTGVIEVDGNACYVECDGVKCVSDLYDRDGSTYTNVADFLAMCDSAFGDFPDLSFENDGWHDQHGLVLVLV